MGSRGDSGRLKSGLSQDHLASLWGARVEHLKYSINPCQHALQRVLLSSKSSVLRQLS